MTSAAAGLLGGAVTIAYVPFLRDQIRDGAIGIPFGTIAPVTVRRAEHPLAFRLCATILVTLLVVLLIACAVAIVETI